MRVTKRTFLTLMGFAGADVACAPFFRGKPSSPVSYTDGPDFTVIPYDPAVHKLTEEDKQTIEAEIASQDYSAVLKGRWQIPELPGAIKSGKVKPLGEVHEFTVEGVTYRIWDNVTSGNFKDVGDEELAEIIKLAEKSIGAAIKANRDLLDTPLPSLDFVFERLNGTNNATTYNRGTIFMDAKLFTERFRYGSMTEYLLRHEVFHVGDYVTDRLHATTGTRQDIHPPRTKFLAEVAGVCWEYCSLFLVEYDDDPASLEKQVLMEKAENNARYMNKKGWPIYQNTWKQSRSRKLKKRKGEPLLTRTIGTYLAGALIDSAVEQAQGDSKKAKEMVLLYNKVMQHLHIPDIGAWNALNARFGIHDQQGHIVTYRSTIDHLRRVSRTPQPAYQKQAAPKNSVYMPDHDASFINQPILLASNP